MTLNMLFREMHLVEENPLGRQTFFSAQSLLPNNTSAHMCAIENLYEQS